DAPGPLRIGNQPNAEAYYAGDIDEIRLSKVARTITPTSSSTSYSTDDWTLGLWHFDGTLADSSGRQENATFEGGRANYVGDTPVGTGIPGPPLISNVRPSEVGATAATVMWTTDTPSSSQVVYGLDGQRTVVDPSLVTTHSLRLGGLSSATRYDIQALSVDAFGNGISASSSLITTDES